MNATARAAVRLMGFAADNAADVLFDGDELIISGSFGKLSVFLPEAELGKLVDDRIVTAVDGDNWGLTENGRRTYRLLNR